MSSVLLKHKDKYRLYNKGAAEWVLKRATRVLNAQGKVEAIDAEMTETLASTVTEMAKRGLRCICLTYTDYEIEDSSKWVIGEGGRTGSCVP